MVSRGMDLGGSQTRIGSTKQDISVIDSAYMEISINAPVKEYIQDKYSDFIIEKHPLETLCGRRFVRGEAMDHYHGKIFVCDNQSNKVEQEPIYANVAYAIAKDLDKTYKYLTEVELGVCIPTSEFYSDKKDYPEVFKQHVSGDYSVFFPLLNRRITFTIAKNSIKVFPEGVVAAFKFKNDSQFVNGITLIVDVGYRSSDITVLNRFKPVGKSAVSRPKGGINIEAALMAELERDNILVSREEVRTALCSKYMYSGGKYVDITEVYNEFIGDPEETRRASMIKALRDSGIETTEDALITAEKSNYINHENTMKDITRQVVSAKKTFASSIKSDIVDVLATQMLNLASVNNIMPIGRPFTGGVSDENSLAAILCKELGSNLRYYSVPSLGTANVEEIIGVMTKDDTTV